MPDTNTNPENNSNGDNDEKNYKTNNGDNNQINNYEKNNYNNNYNNSTNNYDENNYNYNDDNNNNNLNNDNKNDDYKITRYNNNNNNNNNKNNNKDSEIENNKTNESIKKDMDGDKTSNSHHNHEEYHETPDSISYSQEQKQNHLNDSPQNHQQQQQEQKQHFHHPKNRQHHQHQHQQQKQEQEDSFNQNQFKITPPSPPPEIENVPQTFLCWVHCGHSEIKEEIKFENVWRYSHLRPYIKIAFGIEQLSPYIQMYNNSSLTSKSLIDPETLINDPNNLPNNIYIKVFSQQQINSALFLGISNYSISNNFNNYDESLNNKYNNNNISNNNEKDKDYKNDKNNFKVRVFSNDFETEPALEFQSGTDMNTIGKNFNIVGGWLKKKGDLNSQRVKSPFNSGDYVLVGSIPIHKTITIIYHGFFNYFDKNQNVKIKYSDSQIEISEKILNTFSFKSKTKFQLLDISGGVFIDDLNFADLSDEKAYELKINNWYKLN
ncbi:hypothetical protein ACTFIU_003938 [Dictyostelium citrinum]